MGLDMYFSKRTYVKNWDFAPLEQHFDITVKQNGQDVDHIDKSKILYIVEEFGHWRKFNALHNWFVENVQEGVDNCREYSVNSHKLIELLNVLTQVRDNHELAEELLPSTEGFFFGGTDYDDYYFEEVERTIEIIENAIKLAENEPFSDFYYQSSW